MKRLTTAILAAFALASCGSPELAAEPPALAGMQEPAALLTEPDDELERAELAPGSFTGIEVADARATLDALLESPDGLAVAVVVENSPAAQAGISPGDVLHGYRVLPDGAEQALSWPSEWRALELGTPPGAEVELSLERAGAEKQARVTLVQRWRAAERAAVARLREDQRAGVVVRGATEVEARAAGLAPGGGAVVVGLSSDSPWRKADVRFEDLIVAVDGERLVAPDVLIGRIKSAPEGAQLALDLRRDGVERKVLAPLAEREHEFTEIWIPLIFSYERTRNGSETDALLWLFQLERTRAAWSVRLLWLIKFSGGDADRLEEVDS